MGGPKEGRIAGSLDNASVWRARLCENARVMRERVGNEGARGYKGARAMLQKGKPDDGRRWRRCRRFDGLADPG